MVSSNVVCSPAFCKRRRTILRDVEEIEPARRKQDEVEREVITGLFSELRARPPVVLYLSEPPAYDAVRVARTLGARTVLRLPEGTDRLPVDVLVIAPGTLRAGRRRELERIIASARRWGVPTLIDASGAGSQRSRTAAVQRVVDLALWPVIRAAEDEAAALVPPARSSKAVRRRDLFRVAAALVRRGGIAVVTGTRTVVTDGARALIVRNGNPDLASLPDRGRLVTAVLGAFLGVAHRADFLTTIVVGLARLGLAAERASRRTPKRRSLKAQLLRELAAITAEDLHKSIRTTERRLRTAARPTRRTS